VPKEVTFIAAKSLFPMNRLIGGPTDRIKFIWQLNHDSTQGRKNCVAL